MTFEQAKQAARQAAEKLAMDSSHISLIANVIVTELIPFMKDPEIIIPCECGFRLGIYKENLEEIAAGIWGTIPCPKCKARLNDKIKAAQEQLDK